jgi:hypothetical protein
MDDTRAVSHMWWQINKKLRKIKSNKEYGKIFHAHYM